jgi:peptidyl-dipeptidase A
MKTIAFKILALSCVFTTVFFHFCNSGNSENLTLASNKYPSPDDAAAQAFVKQYESTVVPIEIEAARAWWNANTSGRDEDYAVKENAENRLNAALADPARFAELETIRSGQIHDAVLRRQIDLLYLKYLEKHLPTDSLQRMTARANAIEKAFNVFRADVDGQQLTDSQVRKILTESTDSEQVRAAWSASKHVGSIVQKDILELVLMRNDAARKLGFANYHEMKLSLQEQNPAEIIRLFDDLDELTREPFAHAKNDIDIQLSERFQIPIDQLRPWHYQDPFFQSAPDLGAANLDAVFQNVDIPAVCGRFYEGIGLPIDDVLVRSDLYEKTGKSPHAFCIDIDRAGDVRVLCNIVQNEYWMGTTLHELGHSVYSSKFIPDSIPWLVRCEAHILTTEGLAMMFERFASSDQWMLAMGVELSDAKAFAGISQLKRRQKLLIFSRWCQVMLRFEKAMYENPTQDLNKLWWDLVEQYQMLRRPDERDEPDFASKIHIVSAPVYYHNYMMGELFACQLHEKIARTVLNNDDPASCVYADNPAVGGFLKDRVFSQGAIRPWDDLTEFATGAKLNARAFAAEFAK